VRYFLITLLAVWVLGCIPDSDHPLTAPGKEPADPAILGTWFWKDKNETGYIHIGLDEKSRRLTLTMVDFDEDGAMETSVYSGHTSFLEENKYLNLKWAHPPQDELTGYIFVKYAVGADALGIALMDSEAVEKAIKDGALEGRLKKDKWFFSVHITEGQKMLQSFVRKHDKRLFPEMKYMKKLTLQNPLSMRTGRQPPG
jgi:hypothetical protein